MITNPSIAANVGISDWLFGSLQLITSNIDAICIFLICIILGIGVCGYLWGKLWNKEWSFKGIRGVSMVGFSVLAAISLSTADLVAGGNFFQSDAIKVMANKSKPDENGNPGKLTKEDLGYELLNLVAGRKDRHEDGITLSPASVNNLKTTYSLLLGLFATCLVGQLLTVAALGVNDIKIIAPVK